MATMAVVGTAGRPVGEVASTAEVAVGKNASVSAASTIWVATSPAICLPKGVTVGRGVLVGVWSTGAAEVQPAKMAKAMMAEAMMARLQITASKRRIVPHDRWSNGTKNTPQFCQVKKKQV